MQRPLKIAAALTTQVHDSLTLQVQNGSATVLAPLATYSNLNANSGYAQKSFDVSTYKGQTIKLFLKGVEDSRLQTSVVIDDASARVQ